MPIHYRPDYDKAYAWVLEAAAMDVAKSRSAVAEHIPQTTEH